MVKKVAKSGLAKKLGTKLHKAVMAHRDDELVADVGGNLPPGIEGGIAKITSCKFDKYKSGAYEGEYYFMMRAMVVKPTEGPNGEQIAGLYTQVGPEPVCDTPDSSGKKTTLDDHVAWVLNEMRKILGEDATKDIDVDELESLAQMIEEGGYYTRFRTWVGQATKQFSNPRVQHTWSGAVEYEEDGEEEDGGEIDEEEPEEDEEVEEVEEEETDEEEGEDVDLAELGEQADGGDGDAIEQLTELAGENELDPDDYDTWAELAEALSGEEEEEDEEGEVEAPEKSAVYLYKPPRAHNAQECECTSVNKTKGTCSLKSLDDGKLYKDVPWDKLAVEEE